MNKYEVVLTVTYLVEAENVAIAHRIAADLTIRPTWTCGRKRMGPHEKQSVRYQY